jgi:fucose 4-O-acetylase-like acetyltransferase
MLIFAVEPRYHLKSELPSASATVAYEFMRITLMAMFFVISGWSSVAPVRKRGAVRLIQDRARRLLIPLGVGIVVFGPAIKYIELCQGRSIGVNFREVPPLEIGFMEFLPRYFTHGNLLTWSHLWFLGYLFLMTCLMLPLLKQLAGLAPRTAVPAAATVYLPALALAGLLAALDGYWPFQPTLYGDGANFCFFALCFAIGAVIAVWPGFETRLRSEAPRLLVLMLAAFVGVIYFGESLEGRLLVGVTAWAAIGAGLGYAARLDPPTTPALTYLSDASLPVYILHHLPLLLIAMPLLPLPLPVWVKIALIAASTTVVTLAAYHWLVRPHRKVRRLMGMTGKPREA